jgi:hypothetical protein
MLWNYDGSNHLTHIPITNAENFHIEVTSIQAVDGQMAELRKNWNQKKV